MMIGPSPRALVGATDSANKSIFAGKAFTGFSNVEEVQVDAVKEIPFLLEDEIVRQGGKFEKAAEPWGVSLCAYRRIPLAEYAAASCSRIRSPHHWAKPCIRERCRGSHSSSIAGIGHRC